MTKLVLFDLDHTLLDGDSDALWCEFLMDRGLLDRAAFEPRNRQMEADYRAASVDAREFCAFYIGTLAGRTAAGWRPLCEAFLHERIAPRLVAAGRDCVEQHRRRGNELVLTTATNRVIAELTAAALGIEHLIATECELGIDGRLIGSPRGTLNMREGKVARLREWLAARGRRLEDEDSVFYSDSINDLPLLLSVRQPIVVDADPPLRREARARGWQSLRWRAA